MEGQGKNKPVQCLHYQKTRNAVVQ